MRMVRLEDVASLQELLGLRAREEPDRRVYTFLQDGEAEAGHLTHAELDRRARAIAAALRSACEPGDRALLLFPAGLDFIAAFFGCLYAGVAAVPAYPPRPRRDQPRLAAIVRDARPRAVLTTSELLATMPRLAEQRPELGELRWLAVDALDEPSGEPGPLERPDPGAPAFLQYTSGSTAAPKGVIVTNRNLVHNGTLIRDAFGQDASSVVVGWLPLYHDMGLIGNALQPLASGGSCVLMSPTAFLQRPRRWLEAISRYRGTTSGGPNFAYDLCVQKIGSGDREGLDLSSWQVAFNGAEPVRAETLFRFAEAFASSGFRREAFYPCYGLAEATLFVTGPQRGQAAREASFQSAALERNRAVRTEGETEGEETEGARRLVGCGEAWGGQRVEIVDPETGEILQAGRVGEVWIAGPSVAAGYWNQEEETAAAFGGRLPGEDRPFLRTGDLGFFEGGELFVTGRLKDLVILRGRNHYPQDLERTAELSHPTLRPGSSAGFAVDVQGEERLVLVCEVDRHFSGAPEAVEGVASAVRRAVAEEHEVQVHEVVLIRFGTLPKTTSGKVRRRASRTAYQAGELTVVGASALGTEAGTEGGTLTREALLGLPADERPAAVAAFVGARIAAELGLGVRRPGPDEPLTGLGLDSLSAIQLQAAVETATGVPLPLSELLAGCGFGSLVERVLAGLETVSPALPALPESGPEESDTGELPLSPGQEAIWVLHRLAPTGTAYHIAGAARLIPAVEPERLGRALQTLVDRHPALRATFAAGPDGPVQSVVEHAAVTFHAVDTADIADIGADELRARIREEAFRPFDLENGPVFRAALFGDVLQVSVDHVAADFWSLAVLVRELGLLLAGAELPPAPAGRYAEWLRESRKPVDEGLWASWRDRLEGVPPLDLPTDRPRPPVPTWTGGTRTVRLGPGPTAKLRALARASGCTPFMLLLTGFQALLARYSRQEDFLVGAPTSGRTGRYAGLVGYLANPVALRADLSGDPTVPEHLARVRATALEAFGRQGFPFPLLAERLQRDAGRSPLVQVMLALEKSPLPGLEALTAFALGEPGARLALGGTTLESVPLESRSAQRDLTLMAAELDGDLGLSLEWSADLFDTATAERMLGHFGRLLEGLAGATAAPDRRVAELEILDEAERLQVVVDWNRTATAYPREATVHGLFEEQAARTPDRVALAGPPAGLEMTYGELNARANRLARHLRSLGVGPECLVGVAMDRSPELVTAFLAVLKAGGAYVPLDPGHPRERLAAMADEVGLSFLIVDGERSGRPLAGRGLTTVDLRREAPALRRRSPRDPQWGQASARSRNLVYVMFTSGSTGRPKAVGVEHRSVVRLVRDTGFAAFGPDEVFLLLAPTSFDASTLEIWGPLLNGGRLALMPPGPPSFAELGEALERHQVTTLWLTAGLFHQVIEARPEILRPVRQLLAGGDALSPPAVERFLRELPGRTLINGYGPTEGTTFTCTHSLSEPSGAPLQSVPIGRPIANTRAYLLDAALAPVPVGVPGELYAAGDGLARGYLGRPDLTAERFVPAPPSVGESGERLYRTGDLARWRADGTIEFLGRIDQQVKIRGHRVEPGEVEAALARHPAVRQAAVAVRDEGSSSGGRRLVAWVASDRPLAAAELRAFLLERLPEPMVPSAFVSLSALPLNPNGKVDRRALPDPEADEAADFVPPEGPVEEALAAIWTDLLGVDRVGRGDDFFERGGHSLLAARAVARMREPFGVEPPLRELFENPTLAGFAEAVERARGAVLIGKMGPEAPPLVPVPRDRPLPLSYAQERLWLLDRLLPGSPVYNVPAVLRLRGRLRGPILETALAEIVRRHEVLRTGFVEANGRPVQRIAPPEPLAVPLIDLSGPPAFADEARRLAEAEARQPFDLSRPPLVRAARLVLGTAEHWLLLTFHHAAFDGESIAVFLRELGGLCEAFAKGRPSPLPDLAVQYADYAVWQRAWLDGGVLAPRLDWWRRALEGAPAALDLPTDRRRPAVQRFRGAEMPAGLDPALLDRLRGLARREGTTLFAALLAGFAAVLARWTGVEDVVVGTAVANRGRAEVEPLIGFFVNTLPLRVRLDGDGVTGRDLIARARETALGAFAHQEVPFERLVEELQPRRDLSRSPLFEVLLVLRDGPVPVPELPGLDVELLPVHSGTSKFDLTLSLTGQGGTLELDSDLFDPATGLRLTGHLATLLAGLAADPDLPVEDLPLLTPQEERQARVEWNATARPFQSCGLHELFEARAQSDPEGTAVIWGDERWTCARLDREAGRIAALLVDLGVGPDTLVGVLARRTPWMIAGLLAVLKAGGAYVPLDPSYPRERIDFLIADSGARVVLATEGLGEGLAVDRLPLGPGSPEIRTASRPPAAPSQLAYLIYTSGSTGTPKAVAISHGNAAALVAWAADAFPREHLAGVLAATSLGFDLSVFEIFVPLALGGAVILADDALALPGLAAAAEVTLVNTVPSAMEELARARSVPASVRIINLAGEALRRDVADLALALPGVEELWNLYGPSEDTTYSTGAVIGRGTGAPSIGRPLANGRAFVLDAAGRLVPAGVPGELWLGGAGVARGYLGRPDLTADRFRPDPFAGLGDDPGERLYRTGDRVRRSPDGELEFLGRLDHQVKLRGFRIEPGEIEAALAGHPDVSEAAVAVRNGSLIAYLVGSKPVDPETVRSWLAERLPAFMVPAVWVVLDALPRTPNGKLDRKALPEAERGPAVAGETARTPVEEIVAQIWADLLGVEAVGRNDDFFGLGGHSLLAARVAARLRDAFGVDLPLRALFESPTPAALAAAIERGRQEEAFAPISAIPAGGETPLSFAQERLWFLDRLEPGSVVYNLPFVLRLTGELSVGRLRQAFHHVAARQEAVRAVFRSRPHPPAPSPGPPESPAPGEGEAHGLIVELLPVSDFELRVVDLSGRPEAEASRLADELARRPFDLESGPLLRAWLLRLGGAEHRLVVVAHHAVWDGGSTGVFLREVSAAYRGEALPELPVRYADWAAWERSRTEGAEAGLAFWRGQLAGVEDLDLPADRPRPAVRSSRGAAEPIALPAELTRRLRGLARSEQATLFSVLLAGWAALVGRHANQETIAIGVPVARRDRVETEGLIGLFLNTLPLPVRVDGDVPFRELVRQTRDLWLAAHAHRDVPFERLVEELRPRRDLSRTPLFQVLLAVQDGPVEGLRLPGVMARDVPVHTGTAKLDLSLSLAGADDGLSGGLEVDAALFDPTTVRRWIDRFETLLASALDDPERPAGDLPLMTESERAELTAWNDTAAPLPDVHGLHELFERQAVRTPDAVALIHGRERVTYAELEARSWRLARRLRSLGVGPESLVGVLSERTPDLVVSMLAVLRAGGAYVPLDPSYPRERLAFLLADSGARVVVAQGSLVPLLPDFPGEVVEAGDGEDDGDGFWASGAVHPEQLAYLIYTSGSTGVPKGVAIRHASAVARMAWAARTYRPEVLSRVLAATSVGFDLSVFELFAPLSTGGAVVLADDALALPWLPAAGEVTLVNTVPSAMAELVRAGAVPDSVRAVNLAGEPFPPELAARLGELPGVEEVWNLYGPSEDTTYSTGERVETSSVSLVPIGRVPIGRPLENGHAWVLDARLQPLPPGVPGELWLGGAGLARGYLGRPDLTADRFRPDPFASPVEPGARLYRTGDLVRRLPDGRLDYLGRLDQQVKLRGFRIELGEIEAVLAAHPAVREAAAAVRNDASGSPRLVAYVVAYVITVADEIGVDRLRDFLRERVPAFLIPADWVFLDALPRTPNGKLDRKALPDPEAREAVAAYVPPNGPVEEQIAEIWAAVLGRERIGAGDDFFELGGHSLLATRVVSRLRTDFGVELPLRSLFETPTVAGLARRVLAVQHEARPAPPLVPLVPVRDRADLPLSFAQERLWLLDRLEPGNPAWNVPLAAFLSGPFDPARFARACGEVVRRHEVLRTVFRAGETGPVQEIQPPSPQPFPVIDLSGLGDREEELLRLAQEEAVRPFDLSTGPLLRTGAVRLGEQEHVLLLTLHHVAGDGWSLRILLRELSFFYGDEGSLPELPLQYGDWSVWQRGWLTGDVLDGQLAWWREKLRDLPPPVSLPPARPREESGRPRGARLDTVLPEPLAAALRSLGRRAGATTFMTLLAGLQGVLARASGQTDLCIGAPVAGRTRAETEGLIGFFLNTLVLRADLSGDPTFLEMLGRARGETLDAFARQDLPFEKLVEELQPQRDLHGSPFFQVLLNTLNFAAGGTGLEDALDLPGVGLRRLEVPETTAKLDLTLYVAETAEGFRLRFQYDTAVLEAVQVERAAAHLKALLEAVAADPGLRLSEIPLEPGRSAVDRTAGRTAERRAWLDGTLHGRFEERAALAPEAPALVDGGRVWTYADLRRASDAVAASLPGRPLGTTIGLLAAHGAPMVAAMLGALKAGRTYVPLDAALPPARLAAILADCGADEILVDEARLALAQTLAPYLIVIPAEPPAGPVPQVRIDVPPGLPAYILYTSGSTGQAKGVAQTHRNVLHHAGAYADALGLGPADRVALLASYAFDASVMDIYGALLSGAVLHPFDVRGEGTARIAPWLRREGITVYHSTPTLYRRVLDEAGDAGRDSFPAVRLVVLGGERCLAQDLERFRRFFPGESVFVNGLGPTESTLGLQLFASAADLRVERGTVPVGLPVVDTRVTLQTATGRQVSPYGVGEIVLASGHVALGYWGRPDLTAAAFRPDPDSDGGRAYHLGDLGRWLPDGALEFVGRADRQVKIRGQRVELGEVEARLNALPGVREAVAVAREDASGDVRLLAYLLAPEGQSEPRADDLRRELRLRLPDSMIPAEIVFLPTWPLTPTGKVDRAALPDPPARSSQPGVAAQGAGPRTQATPAEALLAGIWSEVLGVDAFGMHDDFFGLGGHSLLATRVLSRVQKAFGIDLPLRAVFEEPTVAGLAARIEEAIGGGRGGRPIRPIRTTAIEPLPRHEGGLPLSFAQERIWFLDRLEPGSAAYNMPAALRLSGRLDVAALRAAFSAIVARHEVLRATFVEADGAPSLAVAEADEVALPEVDLSALASERRRQEAGRLTQAEAVRPFDLARGPLLRLLLLKLEPREHQALFVLHHAAGDGWSLGIVARELSALYPALAEGREPALDPLPIQFADFAAWQREWLGSGVLDAQLAWWRERLDGLPAVLELPADRPRPARPSTRNGARPFHLDAGLTRRLLDLGRAEGATFYMVLLAAFQAWLHRLTGEDDLAVGSPIAGRTVLEAEPLIGPFVNTLVLRGDLRGDPAFRELLARTREAALAAHAHQDLPFEKLVEALRPDRALGHSPLFQALLVLQNTPGGAIVLPDLELTPVPLPSGGAKVDLSLSLTEMAGGLTGLLEFARDLFDETTAERMAGQLVTLMAGLGEDPGLALSELPLLAESERHQLLVEWGDTAANDARDGLCLHEILAARVAKHPEAVAVVTADGGDELTYGELWRRSGRLASRLAAAGIGPGSFVPLLFDSGLDLVVAMLGVLRCGGAFVPLDVDWPEARLAGVLDELADLSGGLVLRAPLEIDSELDEAPGVAMGPESPIYAIYTSGSTGRPKGVSIPHRGIVNRFLWMERFFGAGAAGSVLQTTRCIYDSAVWQIFWPLTLGGRTVLTSSRAGLDPDAVSGLIERHRITMTDFVPSVFNLVVERLVAGDEPAQRLGVLDSLRAVVVGGEEMEPGAARAFRRLFPDVRLVNLYGPTEASIGCICHPVGDSTPARVPIGRPISNVAALVLDPGGRPAPIGVPGELCVAGRCVGHGYLKDEEKTRRVFVANPFSETGGLLYRTGDRARWLPDGTLEFLGRLDHQIKVRGVRIEPAEIEAALRDIPGVTQALVLAVGDGLDRRLAAFVAGDGMTGPELLARLRDRLPRALVPASVSVLPALPLTAAGKIDRKALAALAPAPGPTVLKGRRSRSPLPRRSWRESGPRSYPGCPASLPARSEYTTTSLRWAATRCSRPG